MKNILLYTILVHIIHKKIFKKRYKNNKLKILAPIWNYEFELLHESYSIVEIQN